MVSAVWKSAELWRKEVRKRLYVLSNLFAGDRNSETQDNKCSEYNGKDVTDTDAVKVVNAWL